MADMYDQTAMTPAAPTVQAPKSSDEKPEATDAQKALIKKWTEKIVSAKKHYEPVFKQMRKNQEFARFGADKAWRDGGNYTVPILARHINQVVASLYARNPKAIASRRERMMYKTWDGRQDSLQAAMQMAPLGDPNALAIIQEVVAAQQMNLMYDRMGRTMSILWQYFMDEQGTNYKQQLKAAVRRSKVCKVAWVKLGFQRALEPRPDVSAQINDVTSKIANVEYTLTDIEDGEYDKNGPESEQLRTNMADLQNDPEMVVREGPVLSFPKANQVIVDPACTQLKTLAGARWMAEEFEMDTCDIEKIYKIDVGANFKQYSPDGNPYDKKPEECSARVYQVWDQENLQVFTICEGYPGYLKEPSTPQDWLERFWPYFPIVFNEPEDDKDIYPQSDVEHGEHIQKEYNRAREALRQHRVAARPYYVTAKGLDEHEKRKLANHADHELIEMPTLASGQKVEDLIQRGPVANIDPNLYEVEGVFNDLLRSVGTNDAQIGGTSGGTATESSIADQSLAVQKSDNVDDLDEVLTDVFRAGGQLMLLNLTKQTVVDIVGPGAVWPDTPETRSEAAKEIYLDMKAGSSGRPNRASELANLERAMPYLQQVPGVNPEPLIKKYAPLLDIDPEELWAGSMPSMTALNAIMAKMAGAPAGVGPGGGAPEAQSQGPQGAQNAPSTQRNEPGPQPAYPA
jgi:hypothetical protein